MPVESEHAAKGLEPIRIREPPQDFLATELRGDEGHDLARKRHHPFEEITGRLAAMQRKVGETGTGHCGKS
jgi:hypothetical protein